MAITSKNGVPLSGVSALNGIAKATISAIGGISLSGGGGSTPTAPSIVGTPQMAYNKGIGTPLTVTLTGLVVGDLIIVGTSAYQAATVASTAPTAPSHTFTKIVASDLVINSDLAVNGYRTVATTSGSLTITLNSADYRGLLAFRVQTYDAAIFDGTPVGSTQNQGSAAPVTVTMNATSYTHDLILEIVAWYDSDRVLTYDGAWPLISGTGSPGSNNGNGDQNQMVVIGKQVTSTGVYTPTIISPAISTFFGAVAFAIKGVNV